jgi:hypothetical protein
VDARCRGRSLGLHRDNFPYRRGLQLWRWTTHNGGKMSNPRHKNDVQNLVSDNKERQRSLGLLMKNSFCRASLTIAARSKVFSLAANAANWMAPWSECKKNVRDSLSLIQGWHPPASTGWRNSYLGKRTTIEWRDRHDRGASMPRTATAPACIDFARDLSPTDRRLNGWSRN